MRLVALAYGVLCACQFTHGALPTSGAADASDAIRPDTPPLHTAHVRPIQFTSVIGGPHAGFPVLVAISASWLRQVSQGGDVASASGYDIVFSADAAGMTRLPHELESFDGTNGRLVTWVKVPSLTAATVIYIHYGDSAITASQEDVPGVWSTSYAAVWHLDDMLDSAGASAGTDGGSTGVTGKIGGARSFDGVTDEIDVSSPAAVDDIFDGGGTAEAWFLALSFGGDVRGRIFAKEAFTTGSDLTGWTLHLYNSSVTNCVRLMYSSDPGTYATWATPASSVTTGTWHHIAVTYDRSSSANDPIMYLDGTAAVLSKAAPTGTMAADGAYALRIGNREALDRGFDGSIDEARLSRVIRSADWIATSFANQNAPDTFVSVGQEL